RGGRPAKEPAPQTIPDSPDQARPARAGFHETHGEADQGHDQTYERKGCAPEQIRRVPGRVVPVLSEPLDIGSQLPQAQRVRVDTDSPTEIFRLLVQLNGEAGEVLRADPLVALERPAEAGDQDPALVFVQQFPREDELPDREVPPQVVQADAVDT